MPNAIVSEFSLWNDVIVSFALPGLGAFIAILIKDFIDRRSRRDTYLASDVEYLSKQVDLIRTMAAEYWTQGANEESSIERQIAEAKLIGMLHGCAEIISSNRIGSEPERDTLKYYLRVFRKVCTEGSFGQINVEPNMERVKSIEIEGRVLHAKILEHRRK